MRIASGSAFGDAHLRVCLVLHMARDLFCWPCACFCFVWALLSCFHVLSCLLSWPRPSCYLIISSVAPPVVPHYPPHLLPIYSPCVCSPMPVRCHMFSGCVLILPCPAFSCPACQIASCVFPHRVVFVVCFVFVFNFINKIPSSALLSPCLISLTPDSYENVRLGYSCNIHITEEKCSSNIKKLDRLNVYKTFRSNVFIMFSKW